MIKKHKIHKMESSDFNIFKLYKIYSHRVGVGNKIGVPLYLQGVHLFKFYLWRKNGVI
nr:MAG TPA: hypothetical protein [Caudoviricetes sp.]